ncbi:MAG TPA: NAD(P)-dependent oxidoreductase [Jatrophihabitans sp.]|nr:NAD(P)-dependent oxidoreductase [Jatrophihabitans sp.]
MTRDAADPPVGFLGLGVMGLPMARNLARAGTPLIVWNRTEARTEPLERLGATVAGSPAEVLREAEITLLMLGDEAAVDETLRRRAPGFGEMVRGRVLVHMGTTSPEYSAGLAADVHAAGGRYVEAPVSGSRGPAEAGRLVGMLAGDSDTVATVGELAKPMCRTSFVCGPVPNALLMKLAVNTFLISLVCGLVEAFDAAELFGLDTRLFAQIVTSGPMSSAVADRKLDLLLSQDVAVEAAVSDVHKNTRLIVEAARRRRAASPLLDVCEAMFAETVDAGLGNHDMIAVRHAVSARRPHR